jgi:hypothetical protein
LTPKSKLVLGEKYLNNFLINLHLKRLYVPWVPMEYNYLFSEMELMIIFPVKKIIKNENKK